MDDKHQTEQDGLNIKTMRMEEEAKGLGLLRARRVRELLIHLTMRSDDDRLRSELEYILRFFRQKKKDVPGWPVPWPGDGLDEGQIKLGTIAHGLGGGFSVAIKDLFERLVIVGQIGTGKTYLIYNVLQQLIPQLKDANCSVVIFDPNQDFIALKKLFPEAAWIIQAEKDRDAPFEPPPGVSPKAWARIFIEILGEKMDMRMPARGQMEAAAMAQARKYLAAQ